MYMQTDIFLGSEFVLWYGIMINTGERDSMDKREVYMAGEWQKDNTPISWWRHHKCQVINKLGKEDALPKSYL